MSNIITVIVEDEEFHFRESEIRSEGLLNGDYTDVTTVANILAANIERPTIRSVDGSIVIDRLSFNDCFYDMMADLRGDDIEEEDDV